MDDVGNARVGQPGSHVAREGEQKEKKKPTNERGRQEKKGNRPGRPCGLGGKANRPGAEGKENGLQVMWAPARKGKKRSSSSVLAGKESGHARELGGQSGLGLRWRLAVGPVACWACYSLVRARF